MVYTTRQPDNLSGCLVAIWVINLLDYKLQCFINVTGQKEKEGVISGENKLNTINTSELSSGVYLINVNGNKINKTCFVLRSHLRLAK